MIKFLNKNKNKGAIITLVLVFGAIFILLLAGLLTFILLQHRVSLKKAAWNDSLHIAEAGVNYYRWHLNQYIEADNSDIQDGHNVPGDDWCCKVGGVEYGQDDIQCKDGDFIVCGRCDGESCYEHPYYNPQGELIGKFVLEIKAKKICGQILGVYVNSIGSTIKYPNLERKVEAKFASTSIAEYGSIINEAVWRGGGENTTGKFHTNLGMRMDATNNSLVTSGVNQWVCTPSFGCCGDAWGCDCEWSESLGCYRVSGPSWCCSGSDIPQGCTWSTVNNETECEGVCGAGLPKDLWKFPTDSFDFTGITNDLTGIKTLAQTQTEGKGYYGPSGEKGYHIKFNGDENGTFDIWKVTEAAGISPAYDMEDEWITSYEKINLATEIPLAQNVDLPDCCGLIYIEDNLWIEGTTKGKFTVAAADLRDSVTGPPPPIKEPSIYIVADLGYTAFDGSDSLAMIAQKNILMTFDCDIGSSDPDEIVLRGVFVAQNGWVGRRGYWKTVNPESSRIRDRLVTYGTIVSFIRGEVNYLSSGSIFSGFEEAGESNWDCYFDEKLSRDPPPLLPYVSEELKLISWEEIQ